MAGTKGSSFFDFKNLLSPVLKKDTAWNDLANACNKVLVREVEERRRRLPNSRDSVKNRRGDYLSQITYLPEDDKPAIELNTGKVANLVPGDTIPLAQIVRVINNGNFYGENDQIDYFEVEFKQNNKVIRWLLPTSAPQERSLLLSNAKTLGFDFFSTKLSTKDYERLYEYLNMFFNENGFNDLFIRFIGYIKNLKIEGLPLWSIDDGTDRISVLEVDDPSHKHASQGGDWYLTSHVELRVDINEQNYKYPIDLSELEELFYLFAPVMLVLERVVFAVDANNLLLVAAATGNITYYNSGFLAKTPISPYLGVDYAYAASISYYNAGMLKISAKIPERDFFRYRNHGLELELPLNQSIKNAQVTSFNLLGSNGEILFSSTDKNRITVSTDGKTVVVDFPIEQLPITLPDDFSYQLQSIVKYQNKKDIYGKIQFSDGPYAQNIVFKAQATTHIQHRNAAILSLTKNKMVPNSYAKEPSIGAAVADLVAQGMITLRQVGILSKKEPF